MEREVCGRGTVVSDGAKAEALHNADRRMAAAYFMVVRKWRERSVACCG